MSRRGRQGPVRLAAVLVALLAVGCATVPVEDDEVPGIERVVGRYRGEADVHRLGQAFGQEPSSDGTDVILLSDPASRVGYYFWVALDLEPPAGSSVRLEYVERENQPPLVRNFPLPRNPGGLFGEVALGLTGPDARSPKWYPVAWRVSVLGPDGKVLAAKRSFLWGAAREREPLPR